MQDHINSVRGEDGLREDCCCRAAYAVRVVCALEDMWSGEVEKIVYISDNGKG